MIFCDEGIRIRYQLLQKMLMELLLCLPAHVVQITPSWREKTPFMEDLTKNRPDLKLQGLGAALNIDVFFLFLFFFFFSL